MQPGSPACSFLSLWVTRRNTQSYNGSTPHHHHTASGLSFPAHGACPTKKSLVCLLAGRVVPSACRGMRKPWERPPKARAAPGIRSPCALCCLCGLDTDGSGPLEARNETDCRALRWFETGTGNSARGRAVRAPPSQLRALVEQPYLHGALLLEYSQARAQAVAVQRQTVVGANARDPPGAAGRPG